MNGWDWDVDSKIKWFNTRNQIWQNIDFEINREKIEQKIS